MTSRIRSGAKACKSCRSRQELSNKYLLANIGVDTAENEPLELCGKIIQYYSFVSLVAAFVRREVPENGEEEEGAPQKRKHRYMEGERVPVGVGQDPAKQSAAAEGHASDRRQRCPSAFLVRRNLGGIY